MLGELASPQSPGVQYVVVDRYSIVFEHSVGSADINNSYPMSMRHTLAAFSMTKTLTAIAILQLVERGRIELDAPVIKYVNHPYDPAITIRQLVSHTAGLPNPIPLKWVHLVDDHGSFNEGEALSQVLGEHDEMEFAPGEEYEYSNIGYWLLGSVIEQVTKQRYSDYVSENLFRPLLLSPLEIGFQIVDEKNHAKGYLKKWSLMNLFGRFLIDESVLGEVEEGWLHVKNVYLNGPAFGAAMGTARAFARILQDLLSEQSKLLGSWGKSLLYSQQKTAAGKKIDMTLGWHMSRLNGLVYYYKEGGGAGFRSEMRIYPQVGIASVLMANRTSFNSRKILNDLDSHFVTN